MEVTVEADAELDEALEAPPLLPLVVPLLLLGGSCGWAEDADEASAAPPCSAASAAGGIIIQEGGRGRIIRRNNGEVPSGASLDNLISLLVAKSKVKTSSIRGG